MKTPEFSDPGFFFMNMAVKTSNYNTKNCSEKAIVRQNI